jgi:hypothetical protein
MNWYSELRQKLLDAGFEIVSDAEPCGAALSMTVIAAQADPQLLQKIFDPYAIDPMEKWAKKTGNPMPPEVEDHGEFSLVRRKYAGVAVIPSYPKTPGSYDIIFTPRFDDPPHSGSEEMTVAESMVSALLEANEKVVLAAIRFNGQIITATTHAQAMEKAAAEGVFAPLQIHSFSDLENLNVNFSSRSALYRMPVENGFVTSSGRYVSREEAYDLMRGERDPNGEVYQDSGYLHSDTLNTNESIAVDLDGTLAKDSGWKGPEHIGEPVKKMVDLVQSLLDDGEEVVVFTARAHDGKKSTKEYIRDWLKDNGLPDLEITNEKRPDMEKFYDDKAVEVETNKGVSESFHPVRWLQQKLSRKTNDDTFILPKGAKVIRNDDQHVEVHHDPQLFQWWTYPKLGPGHYIYPTEHLGNGQYMCDVVYKDIDGQWKKDRFELPFDNWEPSEKPVLPVEVEKNSGEVKGGLPGEYERNRTGSRRPGSS